MMLANSFELGKSNVLENLATDLQEYLRRGVDEEATLHEVEKEVFDRVLAIAKCGIDMFLGAQGDGDLGTMVNSPDGKSLLRSEAPQRRELRTIFGEHVFESFVYAQGPRQKIELRPIDARLNLPEGKDSYLVQEFSQMFCVEKAFAVGARQFEAIFRGKLSVDTLEKTSRAMGDQADRFL